MGRQQNNIHRLFGQDGIRGILGEYPLTNGMIFKIGKAAAHLLLCQKRVNGDRLKIIIGKDACLSCKRIEVVLASGITSRGVDVLLGGIISTAALIFLTRKLQADLGVMISASSNRPQESRMKFFSNSGYKLSKAQEAQIEEFIFTYSLNSDLFPYDYNSSSVFQIGEGQKKYINFLNS